MKKSKNIVVKESLQISNIGPLKAVNIEQIKPFTVLIGDSASGKSCILKITALFRYLFKVATVRAWLKSAGVKKNPFKIRAASYWKNCGMSEMLTPKSEVVYTVTVGEQEYVITYKKGAFHLPQIKDISVLEYFKVSFISEYRNVIAPWKTTSSPLRNVSDSTFRKYMKTFLVQLEIYRKYICHILVCICKGYKIRLEQISS